MKTIKKWWSLIAVLVFASVLITACATPTPERIVETVVVPEVVTEEGETIVVTQIVEVPVEVVVTPEPEVIDRTGAWLDTVIFVEEPSADAAVSRLEVGDIDVYAYTVSNAQVVERVNASPELDQVRSFGSYNELTFNPAGPVFEGTGKLNPFALATVREAMNWLIDREYVAQEIMNGLAVPRWTAFNNASGEYANAADVIRNLELNYAYNPDKANEVISAEMEGLGAELVDGKWQYEGEPVEIIVLIRTEDERSQIGDYVATQLENIGFTAIRDYKTAAEASPIWMRGNPSDGLFHVYTGGWISTAIAREMADNFGYFYTNLGLAVPLWQAYVNSEEFYNLANRLYQYDYKSVEERSEMIATVLPLSLQDSMRIWLVDRISYAPKRAEVKVAADLYGSISGSWLWGHTIRREGEVGGSMTIATPSILTEPWNPIAGTNWVYDMTLMRVIGEAAYVYDPFTGLVLPNRVESAAVTVQEGLPVGKTLDWVTLEFAPEIAVPEDVWVDWDATEQRFITAAEVDEEPRTALTKSVVTYPADMFTTVKWHDGSNLSIGDFVMYMIMIFDRAKEESAIYDEARVPQFESFMSSFKGVKIVSQDPLVIETYADNVYLDAEFVPTFWFPYFATAGGSEASWHALTLGVLAEERGEAAFSAAKADALEIEWMSYIAGPTVESLKTSLDTAQAESYLPYAPTMSQYVSAEEVEARYANIAEWYRRRGHFWVGTGPFYLERAFPVEGNVILQRNPDFPDAATRWLQWSVPPLAEIDIDGPDRVTIGAEAMYDIYVTFQGEDYAVADIQQVKFLVFDATNTLVYVGEAEAVEDGLWEAALTTEVSEKLEAGSNKLEVVVVSKRVALPSFFSYQFVTAP